MEDIKKVILVDDRKAFRQSFKLLLRKIGGNQVIAEYSSGEEFLDSLDENFCADIIFMDMELANISGIETTKAALSIKPDLVIIGMSLYDEKLYIDSMIQAGARGYLLKFSDNFSILETIIRHPHAEIFYSQEINPEGNTKHSNKIRILLIDDIEGSLFISQYTLENEGFEVIPYLSPNLALNFAKTISAPDLIITDYLMPEMNGLDFTKKIKQYPGYENIPVLLTSIKINSDIAMEAIEAGVTLILKKPFASKDLIKTVEKMVFEKK